MLNDSLRTEIKLNLKHLNVIVMGDLNISVNIKRHTFMLLGAL